jgi:CubicO group peptidase (beta-lactamase class C family)
MSSTELDILIRLWIPEHEPGIAAALLQAGQIIHCQGYGLANLEWQQPITSQTVFGLGSTTKPFTATAIMLLEQQGKLHLDDPVQTYLPEYATGEHRVTLRHLLTHTSGIPNFVTRPGFWEHHAHAAASVDEVIALFQDLPLDFAPGTTYSYSNSGYVLLGRILERLTDLSYAEVIRQFIFEPLGMTHSCYLEPELVIPQRASGYERANGRFQHARDAAPAVKYAAGGLGSTLEDLILWDAALREGRLLDPATQARMEAPLHLADGHRENYGLGWGIGHYRQHRYVCHAGGVPGFSAFFGRFPEEAVTIILLSNRAGFDAARLAARISQLVFELPPLRRVPAALDPALFSKMIGTYSSVYGTVEIKAEEQALLYVTEETTRPLVPLNETGFYQADDEETEIHFERPNEHGSYGRIRVLEPFHWLTAERVTR